MRSAYCSAPAFGVWGEDGAELVAAQTRDDREPPRLRAFEIVDVEPQPEIAPIVRARQRVDE